MIFSATIRWPIFLVKILYNTDHLVYSLLSPSACQSCYENIYIKTYENHLPQVPLDASMGRAASNE